MKVGSIVECIQTPTQVSDRFTKLNIPLKGSFYTIREIFKDYDLTPVVRVEEMIFGYHKITGQEGAAEISLFREVDIPPLIEAEIQQALTEPLKEGPLKWLYEISSNL